MIQGENYKLYLGDCLEVMDRLIEEGIQVDCILCDPPYGTTKCKWDSIIPFDEMWSRLNKLIKPNGAIVLFGTQPFTSILINSNIKNFKYELIWEKEQGTDFGLAKKKPLKAHENICVFYKKQPTYNPQLEKGKPYTDKRGGTEFVSKHDGKNLMFIGGHRVSYENKDTRYPKTVLKIVRERKPIHPTQKPIELMEWLIKTYTNEGELVLDFTMGSGSTGVACMNTNRRFIGVELDENYFNISCERLKNIK